MRRTLVVLAFAAALVACSKKEKDIDTPAQLSAFPETLRVQRAWDAGVGGKAEPLRLGLGIAVEDGRVYAAGRGGDVAAFSLESGHPLWRTQTKAPLAGGTGAGEGLVVVGSSKGAVIALDAADGKTRWRVNLNGEVLSAPTVTHRAVLVRTVDGKLRGLAPADGKELWQYGQPVPRLSLRGTARPVAAGDAAICGFDNGKVVAVNIADGAVLWEATVAPSRGRTELERLVDIDSAVQVSRDSVYAVGFQGRVAMLALDSGQVWWGRDASSYRGLAIDDDNVYVSTAEGDIVALKRATGAELWRQNALAHRGLSAPAVTANSVVVADFQGFVHWLDKATGALAGRSQAGGGRVSNPPIAIADRVVVINDDGRITSFRTAPLATRVAKGVTPPAATPSAPAAARGAGASPQASPENDPQTPAASPDSPTQKATESSDTVERPRAPDSNSESR